MTILAPKGIRLPSVPAEDLAEVRIQNNATRRVVFTNGEMVQNVRTDESGASARVRRNGYCGFASIPEVSEEAARRVLDAARHSAVFMADHCGNGGVEPPRFAAFTRDMSENWSDSEQAAYVELCRDADQYIQKNCPQLVARTVVAYADTVEKHLRTADGVEAHFAIPRSYVYIVLTAACSEGGTVDLFDAIGGFGSIDQVFAEAGREKLYRSIDRIYQWVMDKAQGVAPKAGKQQVILGGVLAGMLAHEAVGHTVEADFVLGGSIAAKLMDKQVASEKVSLVDFAHTAFGQTCPLPVYVDDEGVKAEDAILIQDGFLRGYMHNRETAARLGGKAVGNARAWSFCDEPLIRMRNTAILPGKDKLEDMIASVDSGYYLLVTNNGQADSTGEFMFGICMGYEIKNGKLGSAIRDTTISGIAFEMLKTVDMLSDDVRWSSSGFCGKKQPMPVGMGGPALRCKVTMGGH